MAIKNKTYGLTTIRNSSFVIRNYVLMAVLAGLQITRVVTGRVAIIHIFGFYDRRLVLQRNRMRRVAFSAFGNVLAIMRDVSVRADLVSRG